VNAFEQAVEDFRVSFMLREVTRTKGNVSAAARALGVHRNTVRRILLEAGYDSRRLMQLSRIHSGMRKPPVSVRVSREGKRESHA
jgi:transposase-like protein